VRVQMLRDGQPIEVEPECEGIVEIGGWTSSVVDAVLAQFLSAYFVWHSLAGVGEAQDTRDAVSEHPGQDTDAAQSLMGEAQDTQDAVGDAGLPDRKIQVLEEFYQFRDHTAISSFLRGNQFLIDLLFEAYYKIQDVFGRNTQVALELFADPEGEAAEELFVLIMTGLSPDEAASALGSLDEEWWLEASSEARCLLNLDVEMV